MHTQNFTFTRLDLNLCFKFFLCLFTFTLEGTEKGYVYIFHTVRNKPSTLFDFVDSCKRTQKSIIL